MFKKVLIVEDHQGMNYSMQRTLEDLGIANDIKNHVYYCDDAFGRIQKAIREEQPYELLITDLSFNEDYSKQTLKDGIALIKAAKAVQPNLKVVVFSSENRLSEAQILFDELQINAFVPKGRGDMQDLKSAIQAVFENKRHISVHLKKAINEKIYFFEPLDKAILNLLVKGIPQKEMQSHLVAMNVKPNGLSSTEKRLKTMREALDLHSNEQLIAYCKDSRII